MSESGSLLRVGRGHMPRGPSVRPDRVPVRAGARAPTGRCAPEAGSVDATVEPEVLLASASLIWHGTLPKARCGGILLLRS
jgi:hypothetical protein